MYFAPLKYKKNINDHSEKNNISAVFDNNFTMNIFPGRELSFPFFCD